jgi:hypothetical protein
VAAPFQRRKPLGDVPILADFGIDPVKQRLLHGPHRAPSVQDVINESPVLFAPLVAWHCSWSNGTSTSTIIARLFPSQALE